MRKRISLVLAVQFVFAWGLLCGQNISSSITGNVTDQQGAAISGAQITVRNAETGAEIRAVADSRGTYSVPGLLAGVYTVTVCCTAPTESRTSTRFVWAE